MKTPNDGASVERAKIKRRIKYIISVHRYSGCAYSVSDFEGLLRWIDSRKNRNAKRPGGLGRK
jgi:hypothetical protein